MRAQFLTPTFLVLLTGCSLLAQAPLQRLSLKEAIRIALENNLQVQIAQEARVATTAGVAIAQGAFDWNLVSGFAYGYQDSATTKQLFPLGPLATTETTAWNRGLSIGVQKPFEWGGNLQVSYNPAYGFSRGDYQDPNTGALLGRFSTKYPYSGGVSGTYTQSILKGFGRPVNEVNVIVARNGSRAADHQFSLALINLVATAETQYWDLVFAARNLENAHAALTLAQEQLEDNKGKVRAGTLAEIEVTGAEAAVARQKLAIIAARSQTRNANDVLMRTLYPRNAPADRMDPTDAPTAYYVLPDRASLEQQALERRVELKVARLAKDSMGALRRAAENRLLPQLNAFVSYNGTSDNRTSLGTANRDLTSLDHPGYSVGLNLAIPIANRTAKGSLAQARANERGSDLTLHDLEFGIRLQVRLALENVESAQESVEAARLTRIYREEDLRAERKKFEKGMSTTFLVLAKQTDLDTSRAAELQAQIGQAKAITSLELATGNLLEARGFAEPR
ncbi:TolC family protein [Mesoterricola silvestris]|uniref:RND transporter n=1 Tax=Mesoterricola silvestris TaxID=2927979 RepID=A0AA48K7T6_9BACT|nr:TolC family protein [Mesoterricola silvestris]BDU71496.1 RND transporter [Mesoterricola silvestris]